MYVENKQLVLVLSLHSRQTLSGSGMKVFVNFIWSCEETEKYIRIPSFLRSYTKGYSESDKIKSKCNN